jgi:hypothetical protein
MKNALRVIRFPKYSEPAILWVPAEDQLKEIKAPGVLDPFCRFLDALHAFLSQQNARVTFHMVGDPQSGVQYLLCPERPYHNAPLEHLDELLRAFLDGVEIRSATLPDQEYPCHAHVFCQVGLFALANPQSPPLIELLGNIAQVSPFCISLSVSPRSWMHFEGTRSKLLDLLARVKSDAGWTDNPDILTGTWRTVVGGKQTSAGKTIQRFNEVARAVATQLERQTKRFDDTRGCGVWQVDRIRLDAASPEGLVALRSAIAGWLNDDLASYQLCDASGFKNAPFLLASQCTLKDSSWDPDFELVNTWSTLELASFTCPPVNEVEGIALRESAHFGKNVEEIPGTRRIVLGQLGGSGGRSRNAEMALDLPSLVEHVFVGGVTGSGKTFTIKRILEQVRSKGLPFLVLEPAKSEYGLPESMGGFDHIYRPGDHRFPPFSINIFDWDYPSISVQTHIDLLKAVFNASFPMYGPMPYILEQALSRSYVRKGWDLASNFHPRVGRQGEEIGQTIPTAEELLEAVRNIIREAGYSQELRSDIRAALEVRIRSLMTGAKGQIYSAKAWVSIADLLKEPAVIQLEQFGDDEDKTFLMGILLIRIYEHRIAQGVYSPNNLKHLLVIEEAYRLLRRVNMDMPNESANVRGKALETFNNLLSEVRAYGQGICVADQIPVNLSRDILKNTNTKIVHRLFSRDDREEVGDAICLNDAQKRSLAFLADGECVLFAAGMGEAVRARVSEPIERWGQCNREKQSTAAGFPDPESVCKAYMEADPYVEELCMQTARVILLPRLEQKGDSFAVLTGVMADRIPKNGMEHEELLVALRPFLARRVVKAAGQILEEYEHIPPAVIMAAREDLVNAITGEGEEAALSRASEARFASYRTNRKFRACGHCSSVCQYGAVASSLLSVEMCDEIRSVFVEDSDTIPEEAVFDRTAQSYASVKSSVAVRRSLGGSEVSDGLAHCILAHIFQSDLQGMERALGFVDTFPAEPRDWRRGIKALGARLEKLLAHLASQSGTEVNGLREIQRSVDTRIQLSTENNTNMLERLEKNQNVLQGLIGAQTHQALNLAQTIEKLGRRFLWIAGGALLLAATVSIAAAVIKIAMQ